MKFVGRCDALVVSRRTPRALLAACGGVDSSGLYGESFGLWLLRIVHQIDAIEALHDSRDAALD